MASMISSDHHRLPVSKRRLKPLMLRDYLLDDLSSSSSNGFKSFPRRRHLDAEIKRSRMFRHNHRLTCGLAFTHAVQRASTALLSAVKLLPFPSSVKSPSRKRDHDSNKNVVLSRSFSMKLFSRSFWMRSSSRRHQRWRSCVSPTDSFSGEVTFSTNAAYDESSSFRSEFFTNSSSSGESETSKENDAVEDATETLNGGVIISGDCVGSHDSDGSCLNDNTEECVNEEREQLSPISILECPFEDDPITPSHQNDEKKLIRKSRRFESLVLEPVDLEKRIEKHVERSQEYDSHIVVETKEDQSENRASRLLALVKDRLKEETNHLLASHKVDNLLLDFFEEGNNERREEDMLVKIVEEWVMRREEEEEEEFMLMSWEVSEKREVYVKAMKWGCINEDEKEFVVEELRNSFFTSLIYELILDLSL